MGTLVFDEAQKWTRWFYPWLAGGVGGLFVSVLVFRYARRQLFSWFAFLVAVVIWSAGGWRVSEHFAIQRALASGRYSVVEGPVENFRPMPHHGHSLERFDVQGVRFRYSDYEETECFNHTTSHGGPIHPGLRVRATYILERFVEHCIVRLEILP